MLCVPLSGGGSDGQDHDCGLSQILLKDWAVFGLADIVSQFFHCCDVLERIDNQGFKLREPLGIEVSDKFVNGIDIVINFNCKIVGLNNQLVFWVCLYWAL